MKKIMTIFLTLLLTSVAVSGCSSSSEKKDANTVADTDSLKVNSDSIKEKVTTIKESEKLEPANVSCEIFFEGMEMTDEETGETSKGTIDERTSFRTKKTYTFCYDSEGFDHLTIRGKGKQLSIFVEEDNKVIFKKNNFDLDGKVTFSSKEIEIIGGAPKYKIVVKQNDTVLFSGKLDSQGCM